MRYVRYDKDTGLILSVTSASPVDTKEHEGLYVCPDRNCEPNPIAVRFSGQYPVGFTNVMGLRDNLVRHIHKAFLNVAHDCVWNLDHQCEVLTKYVFSPEEILRLEFEFNTFIHD